jgi:hypothetical protein
MRTVLNDENIRAYLGHAYWKAQFSDDPRTHNGALLTDATGLFDEKHAVLGCNRFPFGVLGCNIRWEMEEAPSLSKSPPLSGLHLSQRLL